MSKTGIYVSGKNRVFINLPEIGSNASIRCTTLPAHAQVGEFLEARPNYPPDCCGMRASEGYVLYGNTIQVFLGNSDEAPFAEVHDVPESDCGACSKDLFASGHRDGVRLWSLPDLQPRAYIPSTKMITNVRLSANSRLLTIHPLGATVYMWDVARSACFKKIECNDYFLDDRCNNLFCYMRYSPEQIQLERYTFTGVLLNTCLITHHFISAYLSSPGLYIFYERNLNLRTINDRTGALSCEMPLGFESGLYYPTAMATSQDGRWFVILNNYGDIIIWDVGA